MLKEVSNTQHYINYLTKKVLNQLEILMVEVNLDKLSKKFYKCHDI